MMTDYSSCTGCLLKDLATHVGLPSKGNPESGLFIVIDRPNSNENNSGVSFISQANRLFFTLMEKAGITNEEQYYLTYAAKCHAPYKEDEKDVDATRESAKACPPLWLFREIEQYKPKVIIAVGNDSLHALTGKTGIVKYQGTFIDVEINGHACKVLPTFSPSYLMQKKQEQGGKVVSDLIRALNATSATSIGYSKERISQYNYRVVSNIPEFREMYEEIKDRKIVACDIECRGKDPYKSYSDKEPFPLTSIQFSTKEGSAWFLPIAHERFIEGGNIQGLAWDSLFYGEVKNALKDIFENPEHVIIGHNFKFDSKWLKKYLDIDVNLRFDTMLAHGLFEQSSSGLKKLCWQYVTDLGGYEEEQAKYTESLPTEKQWDMFYYPYDTLSIYGCIDADVTFRLFNIFDAKLRKNPELLNLFNMLVQVSMVFTKIEHDGFKVDRAYLAQLNKDFSIEIAQLEEEFKRMAGKQIAKIEADLLKEATNEKGKVSKVKPLEFNISSNDMMSRLFFEEFKIPIDSKHISRKTSKPSLGKAVLVKMQEKYPIAKTLLKYRTMSKLKSSFIDTYPQFLDEKDRIHPTYHLIKSIREDSNKETGTNTGRLSASDPNVQQIPSRGDNALKVKRMFLPDWDDHLLCDCLAPGTKILTRNFIWKNIENLEVGEELVGFDEKLDRKTKLRKSYVEAISSRISIRYRVTTDKGEIICSDNHMWPIFPKTEGNYFSKRDNRYYTHSYGKRMWKKTKDLVVGNYISFLSSPWDTNYCFEDGWMSGMFEGEGWVNKRGGCGIAQNTGDVLERIKEKLSKDGITFVERVQKGHKCVKLEITGAFSPMKIIGKYGVKRFLNKYNFEGMRSWSRQTSPAKIIKVERIEDGPVISVKTSTKTFIAEGFFSHNCDYAGIELRVAAMHCMDPLMKKFFDDKSADFHSLTASKVFKLKIEDITKEQRNVAKTLNFCVPMSTQALTENGFKYFDDLVIGENVFGLDPKDKKVKLTPIIRKYKFNSQELVKLRGNYFSVITTPEHRWFGNKIIDRGKYKEKEDRFFTTKEINKQHTLLLSGEAITKSKLDLSLNECELLGWLLGDGSIEIVPFTGGKSQSNGNKCSHKLVIYQSKNKPEHLDKLKKLLLNFSYKEYNSFVDKKMYLFCLDPDFSRDLWKRTKLSSEKNRSYINFILSMSTNQRKRFLDGFWLAEGHVQKGVKLVSQNKGNLCDAIQLGVFLLGYYPSRRTIFSNYKHKLEKNKNNVCLSIRYCKPYVTGQRLKKEVLPAEDVWCIETGLGTWVMKQEDTICVTGNCVLYGGGASKVAEITGKSEKEAQKFIDEYFKIFPLLKKWIADQKSFASRNLYVKSLFGRIRHLPDANSTNINLREAAYRLATNSPIQSDASDLTLHSIVRISEYLKNFSHSVPDRPSAIRGSVHDSIILSLHEKDAQEIIEHIKYNILESPSLTFIRSRGILLRADFSVGNNWGQKEELVFD